MSAAFGLRCQRDLAGKKRRSTAAAPINPFNVGYFRSKASEPPLHSSRSQHLGSNANTEEAMKFLAPALLALVLLPVETALRPQQTWDKQTQLFPEPKI